MRARASTAIIALERVAAQLGRTSRARNPARGAPAHLAADLVLFTDPERLPDPVAAALRLPRGAVIVHRTYGLAHAEHLAEALARVARMRGLTLLIGRDDRLADRIGAHGVHLPEREMARGRRLRLRHPRWILTAAAHGPRGLARAQSLKLDACFVSPAFPSDSPSAGRALGPVRLAAMLRRATLPVYALGGVDAVSARRLLSGGAAGLAAIGAFRI